MSVWADSALQRTRRCDAPLSAGNGSPGATTAEARRTMANVDLGNRLVPALLVRDMAATLAFYERLGFVVGAQQGAAWAEVRRGAIALQFHTEAPHGTPTTPVCSGTFYFFPPSVLALAEEWRDRVPFAWGPEVMDYGQREFGIQDPNGYWLAFAEPA